MRRVSKCVRLYEIVRGTITTDGCEFLHHFHRTKEELLAHP